MVNNKSQTNKISTLFLVSLVLGVVLISAIFYSVGDVANSFEPTFPENASTVPNHFTLLNVTVNITGELDVRIFANSNVSRLNTQDSLVFHTLNATQNISYNLTTIPIQSDDEGLVALYHFDNLSEFGENETHVFDFAQGLGLSNGTVVRATWNETGKIAGAYNFSKPDDVAGGIIIPQTSSLNVSNLQGGFTISVWVNPLDNGHAGSGRIYDLSSDDGCKDGFCLITNNDLIFFMINNSNHLDTGIIIHGNWYNVIVVVNSTSWGKLYLDGILKTSSQMNKNLANIASTNDFSIGIRSSGTNLNYHGKIDDLAIYNKSLNASEILNRYRLGSNTKYYWKVNATDPSGNSNESDVWEFTTTNPTITANFSSSIGDIRDDFYGVNTHGKWGTDTSLIDVDADGTRETASNFTWHREQFLDSNMNIMRADMYLEDLANEVGTFKTTSGFNNNRAMRYDLVKWASENDVKILFIANSMPSWLRNTTEGWCTTTLFTCPPKNYTRWGEMIVDFINNVTVDGLYNSTIMIQVKNEPDLTASWMSDVTATNINRSLEYNKLYNATYLAVKSAYPNIAVGGATVSDITTTGGKLIYQNWLSNFTTNMDFFSFHAYRGTTDSNYDDLLKNRYDSVIANCTFYGANCSRIILSEYNEFDADTKVNNPDLWGMQLALAYSGTLNNYPTNITMIQYQWAEFINYTEGSANYPDFSQRWTMVAEPQLENEFYRSYNVTKNFATFHSAGSTVYTSTSDNNDVKVVSSKNGNDFFITIINTDTEARNMTLDVGSADINFLADLDGNLFDLGSSTNFGILDSYNIQYLSTPDFKLTEGGDFEFLDFEGTSLGTSNLVFFSLSTGKEKHIASNLTNTINANVTFNVDSCNIKEINYVSNTSAFTNEYKPGEFTCSGSVVTLEVIGIETSSDSNKILITYKGCAGSTRLILNTLIILLALGIVIFTISVFYNKGLREKIGIKLIVFIFIGVIIFVVLIEVIANSKEAFCGG